MFVKLGEATFINVEDTDAVVKDPNFNTTHNSQILSKFAQFTKNLKRIAPKANDFLYFSAVMMHAAESVALDDDGSIKCLANGNPISVGWEKKGESWKWVTNDSNLKPYRNNNRDIFPEEELKKAYKKWVGKPLCIDHKSSSVDHVRGFIVDTYYDDKLKRVIALCALDKKNYPDLAHKVASGYSNNVSMGTAVGKAICTDCGKVASAEPDFCNHMRSKSCYGEINIDLSPIELSIVVNGADPKARIKHIIAAANSLSQYVARKEEELKKIASDNFNFNGTLSFHRSDKFGSDEDTAENTIQISNKNNFQQFKSSVETALKDLETKFKEFESTEQELSSVTEQNYLDEESMSDDMDHDSSDDLSFTSNKFASTQDPLVQELKLITASIKNKLTNLEKDFNKLSTKLQFEEEENMSVNRMNKSAYYQGAGGANEPTPGKQKYNIDPLNEKMRTDGDKHMFVDNMGATDDLFPGDLDRKKLLARAEAEERALRRSAAVALAKEALENRKNAYFQGGGEGNEPTPGKAKYPVDPLAGKLRAQDKHMVGQKPFPDVGDVDGLHPSPESVKEKDELKRKELLRRAGYKAQFVKAANEDGSLNQGDSRWNVYMGDRLVLSASVNEIAGNRADLMYNGIATREFGSKLIEQVKTAGLNSVKRLFKQAQAAPAPAAPAPAAPPAGGMPGMPGMEAGVMPGMEAGGMPGMEGDAEGAAPEGDPAQTAMSLATKMRDLSSDLVEALRALTGEKAEMGALEGLTGGEAPGGMAGMPGMPGAPAMEGATSAPAASAAKSAANLSSELITLANMREELNGALISSMREAVSELKDHREELEIIANMYNSASVNSSNRRYVSGLVSEAFSEAFTTIADTEKLMSAFVKYARGTEAMVKRAQSESEMRKFAQEESEDFEPGSLFDSYEEESDDDPDSEYIGSYDEYSSGYGHDRSQDNKDRYFREINRKNRRDQESMMDIGNEETFDPEDEEQDSPYHILDDVPDLGDDGDDESESDDENYEDTPVVTLPPGTNKDEFMKQNAGIAVKNAGFNLSTKHGRAAYRAKLAADMLETSPLLDDAHPQGGFNTSIDYKVEGNHAHVEDLKETHRAMMDLATASPKVRKEAAVIHRLVSEGKLDVNDLDSLVAEGLDAETAKYYRDYYGQVEGGKEFANELLKEASYAQVEAEKENYRIKLARSYELAYDMVSRGLCLDDRDAISAQVEEIMKFNDESFDSLKRVVARHHVINKTASTNIPQVGLIGSGEIVAKVENEDLYSQFVNAFSKSNRRAF